MSKVTVVTDGTDGTDGTGRVTAVAHGHVSEPTLRKHNARGAHNVIGGLRAGPGQKIHELDLPQDVSGVANFDKLHEAIKPHLK
jgi:hypothetical protein